ncbi:MAG: acyl-CoA dehydrogenase family protein [Myxococcota bacterium]
MRSRHGAEGGFARSLFRGHVREDLLLPFPEMSASERETVTRLLNDLRRLATERIDPRLIDRERHVPPEVMAGLRDLGLFGWGVPVEYGGLGLSPKGHVRVMEELGGIDGSIALMVGAHSSTGLRGLIGIGTESQKRRYLPRLASGEWLAAFAVTEPGAGSDLAGITTRADPAPNGRDFLLNGNKTWITNGGTASLFTILARTGTDESATRPRLTAFLVERDHGLRSGPNEATLGVRGTSTTALYLEDVHVPAANVLGAPGAGFEVAMDALASGRLAVAAACLGASKELARLAVERCRHRRAFGRAIGEFELVRDKLARAAIDIYALESMTYLTAGRSDAGGDDWALESAMCKVFGSETCWQVTNDVLQMAGGLGYMADHPFERMLRDARLPPIFNGPNDVLRTFIALAGLQSPRQRADSWGGLMRKSVHGLAVLGELAIERARSAVERSALDAVHPLLAAEATLLQQSTSRLGSEARRVARELGTSIAERQLVLTRLADSATQLFALAAVLGRTTRAIEARGEEGARREIELASGFATIVRRRLAEALGTLERDEDELLRHIATRISDDGGYPFDPTR